MSEKFKTPETREEAIERKEVLLAKINQYNEEYFSGNLTLTEDEINLIQEEYQFLDEFVDIEAEFVIEEPKEKNFFDKVSIFVWIYVIFAFFSSLYILQEAIGVEVFAFVYNLEWFYDVSNSVLWFGLMGCFLLYPVILIIISLILKLVAFKKKAENKKAFKYVFLGQIICIVINFVVTYFVVIDMFYEMLKG